mmetsp:Transcript_32611/g.104769  ORF Transcript_32611/g.104769 Transcript_32611/m.104769 type:complete len:123 (-) Transcript_32611:1177-1545(-)
MERRRRICSLKSSQGREELHAGGVSSMDTSDAAVLTGGGDGNLRLFNLEDLSLRCSLRGHAAPISSCVLLGESHAASASTDGAVRLWDVDSEAGAAGGGGKRAGGRPPPEIWPRSDRDRTEG